jgi:site-specific DNA-adenine methylase
VAEIIWERLGSPAHYIEPFAGSLAVLLNRRSQPRIETVNDKNGFVCNLWRSVRNDPEAVHFHAHGPLMESEMHSRHAWLLDQGDELVARIEGDPNYYDAQIAGYWLYCVCSLLGAIGTGKGPWKRELGADGVMRLERRPNDPSRGIVRSVPTVSSGRGTYAIDDLYAQLGKLQKRLARVRVLCGDWKRAVTPVIVRSSPPCGILLDPPYAHDLRDDRVYATESNITGEIMDFCKAWESDVNVRIALCGLEGEYDLPGWDVCPWTSRGGYNNHNKSGKENNRTKETIWFSPHCLPPARLF